MKLRPPELAISLGLLLVYVQETQSSQHPLRASARDSNHWKLDLGPSFNDTDNYIFESVASLLQTWPNTRYRNGHTIVPATIPVGTLLHHGTYQHVIPSTPEWTALDPEHSFLFCTAVTEQAGCWHLTLAATRPLRVLYFDGSSAAKMPGALDIQDLIVWGRVDDHEVFEEERRIKDLCKWGDKYGLDGFLREAVDFEVMLCDFTNGVRVVSFLNLRSDIPHEPTISNKNTTASSIPLPKPGEAWVPVFRDLEAGLQLAHFPGLTRAHLDYTRLTSLYDTNLFPSIAERGRDRYLHRAADITTEERRTLMEHLDNVLTSSEPEVPSGVDWSSVVRGVVIRYADRLEILRYQLNLTDPSEVPYQAFQYISAMLTPYTIIQARRPPGSIVDISWASPVFRHCTTTHIAGLSSLTLTPSERVVLKAINGVLHEICRVIVGMWAEGVSLGLDSDESTVEGYRGVAERWYSQVNNLMDWLDWSVWVKCKPACSFEELCWLPTWPGWPWSLHNNDEDGPHMPDPNDDYWVYPRPSCVRRTFPFKLAT